MLWCAVSCQGLTCRTLWCRPEGGLARPRERRSQLGRRQVRQPAGRHREVRAATPRTSCFPDLCPSSAQGLGQAGLHQVKVGCCQRGAEATAECLEEAARVSSAMRVALSVCKACLPACACLVRWAQTLTLLLVAMAPDAGPRTLAGVPGGRSMPLQVRQACTSATSRCSFGWFSGVGDPGAPPVPLVCRGSAGCLQHCRSLCCRQGPRAGLAGPL